MVVYWLIQHVYMSKNINVKESTSSLYEQEKSKYQDLQY